MCISDLSSYVCSYDLEYHTPNPLSAILLHQPKKKGDEGYGKDQNKKPAGSCHAAKVGRKPTACKWIRGPTRISTTILRNLFLPTLFHYVYAVKIVAHWQPSRPVKFPSLFNAFILVDRKSVV